MTKTNGLKELIEKIETDLKKIEEAKGILGLTALSKRQKIGRMPSTTCGSAQSSQKQQTNFLRMWMRRLTVSA